MNVTEIIEHWMGWCPKKQRAKMVSGAVFLSGEMSMKTQKGISSRIKGIAVVVLVLVAALAGMRLEFGSLQSPDWILRDSKAVEGYQWMANNTESDATERSSQSDFRNGTIPKQGDHLHQNGRRRGNRRILQVV